MSGFVWMVLIRMPIKWVVYLFASDVLCTVPSCVSAHAFHNHVVQNDMASWHFLSQCMCVWLMAMVRQFNKCIFIESYSGFFLLCSAFREECAEINDGNGSCQLEYCWCQSIVSNGQKLPPTWSHLFCSLSSVSTSGDHEFAYELGPSVTAKIRLESSFIRLAATMWTITLALS